MSRVHIGKWFGKGTKQENSTPFPLLDASSSQAASVDDKILATHVSKEKIGLFELSTNESEKAIDVVAVHGLQGDAYRTWEHDNGSLWLRDFLPADIPNARIMTFGYDSTVAFSKSVAKIEDKALELLNHLSAKRSPAAPGSPPKPIVFICHSLGGIVVKKALVLAHDCNSNLDYKDISENTKAIAFLGVPHEGSDSAKWAGFAANLLKSASIGISTNTAIVSDLEKGSSTLARISKQFVAKTPDMILFTFYETEKLHGVVVVDKQSARTGLKNERLFPVNANHRTMCKMPSSTSHQYITVGSWIAKLTQRVLADTIALGVLSTEAPTALYYNVPNRRVLQFFGREDILQRIDEALSEGPGTRIAVLQGMGGQGKSQIALEYCYKKKTTLYPAIFWIDATTENSTKGSFQEISEQIKKPADTLHDTKARIGLVLRMLSSWPIRWLLVFDNYDNPETFPNIRDFIPQSELGAILVTSRHADSDMLVLDQENHLIKLYGLEEKPAILLLTQQSQTKDFESKDAKEIVRRLAYHPLAITQAGAYIKKAELQLSDFMKHYREKKEKILKNTPPLSQYRKKLGKNEEETSLNVFTTWELSFEQLESEASENNREVKLLTLLAFLDNEDISEQLFAEFNNCEKANPKSAKLLDWLTAFTSGTSGQWDSDSFAEVLITLRNLSLLQGFAPEPDGFYHASLHPLIKDWIQLRTGARVGQDNTYMAATLLSGMLSNSWRKDQFELPLSVQQNFLLHIMALEIAHEKYFSWQVEIPEPRDIHNEYRTSQFWFARFLSSIGSYQLAVILFQQVVTQEEKCFGLEHPYTLTSTGHLAATYCNQGRWKEAEELQARVMETRKKVLGLEHPDTLTSTDNLALIYTNQGRWGEAEELQVQVMESTKKILGLEHPATLTSTANLAATYWHQGWWTEAEELQVRVMETKKGVLGLEHPETLTSTDDLGKTYCNQGRWKEAEELQVQVMETRKKIQGLEHPGTLTSMDNLALTYLSQGRWREAEELQVELIETTKRTLGLEHPDSLVSTANLASTYLNQGRLKEAEELQVQVMESTQRLLGPEHPDTLTSTANLASTYTKQGRWKEAEELQVRIMETTKRVVGPEHPSTLIDMGNLAVTFWSQDQTNKAIQLMTEVVELRRQKTGPDHPSTIGAIRMLQNWTNEMGYT